MVVRRFMNKTGILKVFLVGSRKYVCLSSELPESESARVGDHCDEFYRTKSVRFRGPGRRDHRPCDEIESGPILGDPIEAQENIEDDYGDVPELVDEDDVDEVDEASRVLEEADLQAKTLRRSSVKREFI